MSNGPPPRPPGAPKPPPRRIDPSSEQNHNPFMVPDSAAQVPTPEPSAANPFLAASPAPSPIAQVEQARVVPPSQGAPLRVQRGVTAPSVRDPHAEFRKGSWKKPLLVTVLAATIVGALFFGLPEQESEKPSPFADSSGPATVIGASVSPEVIPDPDRPSLQNPNPSEQRTRKDESPVAPTERADGSENFGDAFKSSAK